MFVCLFIYLFISRSEQNGEAPPSSSANTTSASAIVVPSQDSLIGDLLSMDIGSGPSTSANVATTQPPSMDLLGGGLDALVFISSRIIKLKLYLGT